MNIYFLILLTIKKIKNNVYIYLNKYGECSEVRSKLFQICNLFKSLFAAVFKHLKYLR